MNDEARMANDEGMTKSEGTREDIEEAFWNGGTTAVVREEPERKRIYDLEERTARFAEAVMDFAKAIPQHAVTYRIINQLVGAAISVSATTSKTTTRSLKRKRKRAKPSTFSG